jgi:hypothetical protein
MTVGQLEVRELLLRAAEVLHHGSHEELVLFLEALVDPLEFSLELVEMRRDLS